MQATKHTERNLQIREMTHKLTERVKELNCLYGISKLVETANRTMGEMVQSAVEIIPAGWQYPEITCVRIKLAKKEFKTANFKETAFKQEETIYVNGNKYGKLEVFYLVEKPYCYEGPFLKEERDLIHALAERLGHVVERKLSDERLRLLYQKEKELTEKLQEEMENKVNFTRHLIHELKTPLTSLLATSQLLHEESRGKRLEKLAEYVWENACGLNNRIDELHDMIKGEIGKLELEPRNMYLDRLLQSIVDESQPLAQQCNMQLAIELGSSDIKINGDASRIRQVALNLLNNAFKYATESGRVLIKIDKTGDYAKVEVKDWGPGIKKQEQQMVFEPYYRTAKAIENPHGLGIGLALCKVIIELHGGRIWIKSDPGKGSSVYFTLPLLTKKGKKTATVKE